MRLNYENCYLRRILFQTLKQLSDYNSRIAWTFDGNIKNESCKWYLGTKEQKSTFLVVSRTCTRNVGRLVRILPTPAKLNNFRVI